MVIYLTSDMMMSKKVDGVRVACPMDNTNGIIENLKHDLGNRGTIVFVASDPNGYEKTDSYASNTLESFKLSGIEFERIIVLDNRNYENAEGLLKSADLIFVAGGHVPTQNAFLKKIDFKTHTQYLRTVIIGQSAGAMNLSRCVYNYPDDSSQLDDPQFLDGAWKTGYIIVPHINKLMEKTDELVVFDNYIIPDSKGKLFYGLTDSSYIRVGMNTTCHGEVYKIKEGTCEKICESGQMLDISQEESYWVGAPNEKYY